MRILRRYKNLDDERLMRLVQKRDAGAFDALYKKYSKAILHYFYRMFKGDENKAQDFLQETFLRVYERSAQFNAEHAFRSWLYTIAHNLCKNEYRRLCNQGDNVHAENIEKRVFHNDLQQEFRYDQNVFKAALWKELESMEYEQKTTFLLRYQSNLSIKEIAAILNCPQGTIKSRLFNVTQRLADKLLPFSRG
jgi:RNA polymerase sigma-70 factor (ECF subfamily)